MADGKNLPTPHYKKIYTPITNFKINIDIISFELRQNKS